jgi:hypothetical protein
MKRLVPVLVLCCLPACQLVFNENGGDDDCETVDDGYAEYRNPYDGTCEIVGGGCGQDTSGSDFADPAPPDWQDWASCSACEGLDETTCRATDGCRAIDVVGWDTPIVVYTTCWGTAPSGPVHGECVGLDAYQCSRHDDCRATYRSDLEGQLSFEACLPEAPICDGGGAPWPTDELRNPFTGQCEQFGGGGCDEQLDPPQLPDWAVCHACSGLDEATCLVADGCRAAYVDPAAGGDAALVYLECFGTAPSGPVHGSCVNLDAQECSRHDDCAAVYAADVPFFERCIAEQPTVEPAPACAEVHDEATCIDLVDGCLASGQCNEACTPLYQGEDCSCDPSGCSCQSWLYQRCASAGHDGQGFLCGDLMCTGDSFCHAFYPGMGDIDPTFQCAPMPDTCLPTTDDGLPGEGDCACLGYNLGQEHGGCFCSADAAGNATISCAAP